MGYIYIVQCYKNYKIGYSETPAKRLKALQTGNPYPVKMIGLTRGTPDLETAWHRTFHAKRIKGEWFQLTPEDIKRILGGKPDPGSFPKPKRSPKNPGINYGRYNVLTIVENLSCHVGKTSAWLTATSGSCSTWLMDGPTRG